MGARDRIRKKLDMKRAREVEEIQKRVEEAHDVSFDPASLIAIALHDPTTLHCVPKEMESKTIKELLSSLILQWRL